MAVFIEQCPILAGIPQARLPAAAHTYFAFVSNVSALATYPARRLAPIGASDLMSAVDHFSVGCVRGRLPLSAHNPVVSRLEIP
jgi:hypothetical protein